MKRELLLMRHGKTECNSVSADFQRPLKRKGERDAQRVGEWLGQSQWIPDWVITSPAIRARNSAILCCRELALSGKGENREKMAVLYQQPLYEADRESLFSQLRKIPESVKRVLLIAHNPGLENLLQALSDSPVPTPQHGKLFPTGALARFIIQGRWNKIKTGKGQLQSLHYPGDLSLRPTSGKRSHASKQTKRARSPVSPHFFTQSGVIPYRYRNGERQVMLVTSSSGGHWIFPKGGVEAGLTSEASAVREALEEAGVKGKIQGAVGHYHHQKWNGTCIVTLYPMRVTRVLKQRHWEEPERQRKWFTVEQAARKISNRGLRNLLLQMK
ncbi:MAG: NUDIX domain-containing protein [Gammaproteobacteria bacterium]|nr:NUDIX domain-containing protein [Gammaproteobacteria bacterium]MBT3489834.1 NUDIX domain-containing protein [Gammaproteobacteria bacterium]MBT3718658.1 NUDIX domain-containing protein [Gammaproteobacteria bacterium]MBT3844730.1 NUDIX domain-containing protein [Gammaproteobacteria bacterium]MBT3893842.1 NUDIX domain-containing protein [Gammaproteobacteria bacterium]